MINPLSSVKSWLYHLGDVDTAEAAKIAISSAGLVVIDYANTNGDAPAPYTPAQLSVMRGSNDKLIVSYLSIGEAEEYRDYWKAEWNSTPPSFLSASNPEWPDNFKVKYWEPAWQKIMFDYVDKIIAGGFNGLYLDIVDGFQYWEEVAPNTGINYRTEMAEFVAAIDEHATAKLAAMGDTRKFVILGQNGEELADNPTYLAHIDGIAKEDLRFYYPNGSESSFKPVPDGWFSGSKPYLEKAEAAGVEVFVVEYMTKTRQTQNTAALQAEIDYLHSKNIPLYIAEERDLLNIYAQPDINGPIEGSGGSGGGTVGGGGTGSGGGTGGGGVGPVIPPSGIHVIMGTANADVIRGGTGSDQIQGGAGNDRLSGFKGNDMLQGDAGNDTLLGGYGNDTLTGGTGNDSLNGGKGDDTAVFSGSTKVVVDLNLTTAQNTGHGRDTLISVENVRSGSGNDILTGNGRANLLDGAVGNDKLVGGAGNDTLLGGAGNDTL
ncbi:MAG: endo alpha-1,4 polygalactosaminidase, partial [Rhodoferax sp.]|nr:endo alpha-1,4 polygalactosaminidase [Pseudorhodobacter sp.]